MKLPTLYRNAKVRNLCVLFVLMLGIGFIAHNLGSAIKDSKAFVKSPHTKISTTNENNMSLQPAESFWDESTDVRAEIPVDVLSRAEKLIIANKNVRVDDVNIFYRESSSSVSSEVTLLLLHGKSFSSKIWLDLTTISIFTAAGYRTIAVDLPGFGNSDKLPAAMEKSDFLLRLITRLEISKPVIVSPSFSGYYTLPLLVRDWQSFTGFIPVAPVGQDVIQSLNTCHHQEESNDVHRNIMVERFNRLPDYFKEQVENSLPDVSCIRAPTLVIHGEFDRSKSSALLSLLPNARTFEIPQGKHPCYLQNPKLFHAIIYDFLLRIVEVESRSKDGKIT